VTISLPIVAAGARTPLGLGAVVTALGLRAGKTALAGAPFAGRQRDMILAGLIPTLPWKSSASDRAARLAIDALREALVALPASLASRRVAVLLHVSAEADTDVVRREAVGRIEAMLRIELGARDRLGEVAIAIEGSTTAGDALPRAASILATKAADIVLWGGAHSDISTASIRALAGAGRLFDSQHLDSVVPGEGAAVVALTTEAHARSLGPRPVIEGVGGATTDATPANEVPVSGDALLEAIRAAMADAGSEPAGWVLSDVAYEALRMREWEMVQVRSRALLSVPYKWDALSQRMGRTGAAQLPLAAAVVAASYGLGHVPSPSVLALSGTDAGRRSAVWMRAIGGPGASSASADRV
jgi:3-oxoacyl-[acyl-carrier-protein] synthase-1